MRFSLRSFAVSHGAAFANANSFFYSYIAVLCSSSFLQAPLSVHGVSVFPLLPPQQELAGSPCSGRQEIWIQNLAEAGCIMRLPWAGQSFSHELLCSLSALFPLVQTGVLGFAVAPEGWSRAWARGAVCCGAGADLRPAHLCVSCPALVRGAGSALRVSLGLLSRHQPSPEAMLTLICWMQH